MRLSRRRDERVEQAHELYKKGIKLVEIAAQLGIPEGTVRRWKSTYGWDPEHLKKNSERSEKNSERSEKKTLKKEHVSKAVETVLENDKLSAEQQLFCLFYAMNPNVTSAYQKAYGCSRKSAISNSYRMMENDGIRKEIQRLKKERFETQLFDEHDIFQWFLDIATADITDYVTFGREEVPVMNMFGPVVDKETGEQVMKEVNCVKFKESTEVDGRLIKKVKNGKDGASIELHDPMKAMEWLAEHMSMGTTKQQSLAQSIQAAYERRVAPVQPEEEDDNGSGSD